MVRWMNMRMQPLTIMLFRNILDKPLWNVPITKNIIQGNNIESNLAVYNSPQRESL